jgi:hypothetical protein
MQSATKASGSKGILQMETVSLDFAGTLQVLGYM